MNRGVYASGSMVGEARVRVVAETSRSRTVVHHRPLNQVQQTHVLASCAEPTLFEEYIRGSRSAPCGGEKDSSLAQRRSSPPAGGAVAALSIAVIRCGGVGRVLSDIPYFVHNPR